MLSKERHQTATGPFKLNPQIDFRRCQDGVVDALFAVWKRGVRWPVLDLATGSGKSITIGEIARRVLNRTHPRLTDIILRKLQDAGVVTTV